MEALREGLYLVTDLFCLELSVIVNGTYKEKCGCYVSGHFVCFVSIFWHSRTFQTHTNTEVFRVFLFIVFIRFAAKPFLPHSEDKLHYNCSFPASHLRKTERQVNRKHSLSERVRTIWQCWIVWFRLINSLIWSWSRAETANTELEGGLSRKAWILDSDRFQNCSIPVL
jgi:hypothetical protein